LPDIQRKAAAYLHTMNSSLHLNNDKNLANNLFDLQNAFQDHLQTLQTKLKTYLEKEKLPVKSRPPVSMDNLFDTYLEGFYINDTLVSKMRFLKFKQGFPLKKGELAYEKDPRNPNKIVYYQFHDNRFDAFSMMKETPEVDFTNPGHRGNYGVNKTYEIFTFLSNLMENTPMKFIELAAIRGDIAKDDKDIEYSPDNNLHYKFARASCLTLRGSSVISSFQCDTSGQCSFREEPEEKKGLGEEYNSPYVQYITPSVAVGGAVALSLFPVFFKQYSLYIIITVMLIIIILILYYIVSTQQISRDLVCLESFQESKLKVPII